MPKVKRKLNGKFIALLVFVILVVLSLYKIPRFIDQNKLKDLGYSKEAIKAIYQLKLKNTILEKEAYSDYLNAEIVKEDFKKEYLDLYLKRNSLNEDDFYLYERLKSLKGYSDEEMISLFSELTNTELIPLCVFDKVDINSYIEDCKNHPDNNSSYFILSNDYLHPYENSEAVKDKSSIEAFISTKFTLEQYIPEKLVTISRQNAVDNCQLQSQALEAFSELCADLRKENPGIYAVDAYRSYDDQADYAKVKMDAVKAGYYDAQSGLGVYVVSAENESVSLFKQTTAYKWLNEHAHEYGFIFRYPEGKEAVTGSIAVNNYLRFVGKDLALKIKDSGLSFDEYYMLYLY